MGSIPATQDWRKWNYNQWHLFNPGLFAGIYNPADDTTDGYKYICPIYVGNCATTGVPDWQVHFTTSAGAAGSRAIRAFIRRTGRHGVGFNRVAQWQSNRRARVGLKNADADVRSGFSGTYQWVVFQWNTSQLNPPGADNVLTFNVDRTQGVMYDALRMEITNRSVAHEVTGWNDYEI